MKKKAAALKYDKNYPAPKVTAIGLGEIAQKIIDTAEKSNVPIIVNEELANNLCSLSVDDYIPLELYETVAQILAFIYALNDTKNK